MKSKRLSWRLAVPMVSSGICSSKTTSTEHFQDGILCFLVYDYHSSALLRQVWPTGLGPSLPVLRLLIAVVNTPRLLPSPDPEHLKLALITSFEAAEVTIPRQKRSIQLYTLHVSLVTLCGRCEENE